MAGQRLAAGIEGVGRLGIDRQADALADPDIAVPMQFHGDEFGNAVDGDIDQRRAAKLLDHGNRAGEIAALRFGKRDGIGTNADRHGTAAFRAREIRHAHQPGAGEADSALAVDRCDGALEEVHGRLAEKAGNEAVARRLVKLERRAHLLDRRRD